MPARTSGSRYASGRRQNAAQKPSVQSCGTGTRLDRRRRGRAAPASRSHGREPCLVVLDRGRQVVACQPEIAPITGVPGQDHDCGARPAAARRCRARGRSSGGPSGSRAPRRTSRRRTAATPPSPGCTGRAGRPLRDHHRRRLDRRHLAVGRLVRARAGADVHHRPRVAERPGRSAPGCAGRARACGGTSCRARRRSPSAAPNIAAGRERRRAGPRCDMTSPARAIARRSGCGSPESRRCSCGSPVQSTRRSRTAARTRSSCASTRTRAWSASARSTRSRTSRRRSSTRPRRT